MERKVFLKQENDKVIVMIKHLTSGQLEPLATYDNKTKEMVLHNVPRYYYVLRHIESLHLILGYIESKGLIEPTGDSEPLPIDRVLDKLEKRGAPAESREIAWMVDEGVLRWILSAVTLSHDFYNEVVDLLPKANGLYVIAKSSVKDRDGLENMNPLSLISASLKKSLNAVLGDNVEINSIFILGFDLGIDDDVVLFNLQNTANFIDFKNEVKALRKGDK